jgi:hypothetical protein
MAVSPYPQYWADKVGKSDGPLYRGFRRANADADVDVTPQAYGRKAAAMQAILAQFPRACACGCGEPTKGGEFRMGHDARHKSNLIKEVLAGGNEDALAEIERRGWLSFLDKAREIADRPIVPKAERKAKDEESDEEKARKAHDRIHITKAACTVLKAVGQYYRASGMQIRIDTIDEAARIIEGSHADLVATPSVAEWGQFSSRQVAACHRTRGIFFPGTDFIAWLDEQGEA